MLTSIRSLLTAAALVPVLFPASALGAHDQRPPDCTRGAFHAQAKAVYGNASPVTTAERRNVRRLVLCQRSARSRRIVRWHLARYKRSYRYRVQVAAVTPYRGPGGTRWAIPYRVVACESHGSWGAYNASSAAGPYQLMGEWGRPFPANTRAARLAHHQIAHRLWNGGAGASNWLCA